jgi:flagella basal body P-ring formation protein FlgA
VARYLAQQTAGGDHLDIQVGAIDSRLRLSACATDLEHFLPPGGRKSGNVTVGIRCMHPKPWTLYVTAQVRHYQKVVVLARSLPRNARLTGADLQLEERDSSLLPLGYFSALEEVEGKHLSRPLNAGYLLHSTVLLAPKVIRRGQEVTLLAQSDGLEVRSRGNALQDGGMGDRIAVKNQHSRQVIEGIIVEEGVIRVPIL